MSKETWFREYERLWNARENMPREHQKTDEELAQSALDNCMEYELDRADLAQEEK